MTKIHMMFSLIYKMRLSSELASCLPKCESQVFFLILIFLFLTHCAACRILAPWSETKPAFSSPREVKQLNHWTTMKVPRVQMYMYIYIVMWIYIQSCDHINSAWSENSTHNIIRVNKNLRISVLCNIVTNTIAWKI